MIIVLRGRLDTSMLRCYDSCLMVITASTYRVIMHFLIVKKLICKEQLVRAFLCLSSNRLFQVCLRWSEATFGFSSNSSQKLRRIIGGGLHLL